MLYFELNICIYVSFDAEVVMKRSVRIKDTEDTANVLLALSVGKQPSLFAHLEKYNASNSYNKIVIVVGQRDKKYVQMGEGLVSRSIIPESCLFIVDACGHALHMEAPEEIAQIVRSMLLV